MRKITRDAVNAFREGTNFIRGNTSVYHFESIGLVQMQLHGNTIAEREVFTDSLRVTSAGWETPTTKERLNGLLSAIGCQGIYQKDFTWYWDDGTPFGDGWQGARAYPVPRGDRE